MEKSPIDEAPVIEFDYRDPDGEALPLTRCVCGQTFPAWDFILPVEASDAKECPTCYRKLWWSQKITIHIEP